MRPSARPKAASVSIALGYRFSDVHRGDEVELVARTNRLAVSALGQAMQDGGIGERIRVKNSDSGKILYGQILDAATIQVGQ